MGESIRMRAVFLVAAMVIAIVAIGLEATAKPKNTSTLQIPKGATVEMQSQSTMRLNNSNGETGTFNCNCVGANTTGSCILGRGSSSIICGDVGSTCSGTCKLYTTTGGRAGGAMMKK